MNQEKLNVTQLLVSFVLGGFTFNFIKVNKYIKNRSNFSLFNFNLW